MDSLRYWVAEMGVDGFRFDLASTLARQDGGFEDVAAFFDLVWQDPIVAQVKQIAEPWDVGQGDSNDVGRFPAGWSEWNDKFRDTVRGVVAVRARSRPRAMSRRRSAGVNTGTAAAVMWLLPPGSGRPPVPAPTAACDRSVVWRR